MPFIAASDGTELYYEVKGEGFPLVFTHGNMGFGQQFFLQTRIFRKQYRCILHDSRGCGLSGKPHADIYDTKTHASDLRTILQALGVQKAVHIGHSFGGPIAVTAGARQKHKQLKPTCFQDSCCNCERSYSTHGDTYYWRGRFHRLRSGAFTH